MTLELFNIYAQTIVSMYNNGLNQDTSLEQNAHFEYKLLQI